MGNTCTGSKTDAKLERLRAERERRLGYSLDAQRTFVRSSSHHHPPVTNAQGGKNLSIPIVSDVLSRNASSQLGSHFPSMRGPMVQPPGRVHGGSGSRQLIPNTPMRAGYPPTARTQRSQSASGDLRSRVPTRGLSPTRSAQATPRRGSLVWSESERAARASPLHSVSPILLRPSGKQTATQQLLVSPHAARYSPPQSKRASKSRRRGDSVGDSRRRSRRHPSDSSDSSSESETSTYSSETGSSSSTSSNGYGRRSRRGSRYSRRYDSQAHREAPVQPVGAPPAVQATPRAASQNSRSSASPMRLKPVMKQALNYLCTQEIQERSELANEELDARSNLQDEFRYVLEMEIIRIAAFEIFALEKKSRLAVFEQEEVERNILLYWLAQVLEEARLEELLRRTQARQASMRSVRRDSASQWRSADRRWNSNTSAPQHEFTPAAAAAPSPLPPPPVVPTDSYRRRHPPNKDDDDDHQDTGVDDDDDGGVMFDYDGGSDGVSPGEIGRGGWQKPRAVGVQPLYTSPRALDSPRSDERSEVRRGASRSSSRGARTRRNSRSPRQHRPTYEDLLNHRAPTALDYHDEAALHSTIRRQREMLERTSDLYGVGPSRRAPRAPANALPLQWEGRHANATTPSSHRQRSMTPSAQRLHADAAALEQSSLSLKDASDSATRQRLTALLRT